jgi:alpha-L-fucosidase
MKTKLLFILLLALAGQSVFTQQKIWDETAEQKARRLQWWTDARFGMFIHWGIYALPARHEWVKNYERLTNEQYQKYFEEFNPDLYDPRDWARMAKKAGMKYAVITSKHHDGFCLFDSEYTDYDAVNTPYGRDLIREWVEAFRGEGLGVGFYYSLIDWHHPDFTVDRYHPQRTENPQEYAKMNRGRNMARYREYVKNQVRELLTNYGKIDILWLDFSYPGEFGKGRDDWGSVELVSMVRRMQPDILLNNRSDLMDYRGGWDFITPEQYKVLDWPEIDGEKVPWETCQTFSGSWGYYRDEKTWKDNKQLLVLLIESVSKGGNLLLNVGPTGRGTIDYRAQNALAKMGEWMKHNNRSIYKCTQAPSGFEVPANTLLTYNPETNRLYVHLLDYPMRYFRLPGYKGKVKYAQFLHDASELQFTDPPRSIEAGDDLYLRPPVNKPDVEIPVIELILN